MEAERLWSRGHLPRTERRHLRAMLNWFSEHIPEPPKDIQQSSAIFWFKSSAQENVQHIQRLIRFLREHGSHIVLQQCDSLDNIVYEDDFQVAANTSTSD